jgi:hypothetical protein
MFLIQSMKYTGLNTAHSTGCRVLPIAISNSKTPYWTAAHAHW